MHVIKDKLFKTPPLFRLIQSQSDTPWKEMFKVFNMGHRMEIYLPERFANAIIDIAKEYNIEAKIIGRCERSDAKQLTIASEYGSFVYS